jgi:hypothetical protein
MSWKRNERQVRFDYVQDERILASIAYEVFFGDLPHYMIEDFLDERGLPPIPDDVVNPPRPEPSAPPCFTPAELLRILDGPTGGRER